MDHYCYGIEIKEAAICSSSILDRIREIRNVYKILVGKPNYKCTNYKCNLEREVNHSSPSCIGCALTSHPHTSLYHAA
jgi:hypothetical protein